MRTKESTFLGTVQNPYATNFKIFKRHHNVGEILGNIVEIGDKFSKIDDRLSVEDIVLTSTDK